ncbi:MAG: hypothetical protein RL264_1301 [Bacteroidota bacterium]|jgi:restriction endonuclease S subunit
MKKYDSYKDSGIEWIGEIPSHWEIKKLKYFGVITLGKMLTPEDKGGYVLKRYLRAKNIEWYSPNIEDVKEMWFSPKEVAQYRLFKNDLLVSEGGEVGRTCIWNEEIDECYIQNSVHRVSFGGTENANYFLNQFILFGKKGHFDAIVNRISIAHLTKEKLGDVQFIYPPIEEQTTIANYLDQKTSQIDDLIAKKERLIQLLEEERTAIINHAVTKGLPAEERLKVGLDPTVPMKDSGIEWLGEIPAHWEVKRIKHLLNEPLKYGANESAEEENLDDPRYIRITDFGNDGKLKENTFKSLPYSKAENFLLNEGDILFARSGATVGKTFFFKNYQGIACFAGYLIKASCNQKLLLPEFLYQFTNTGSYENWKQSIFQQATIQNIGADKYNQLKIAIPPVSEQKEIIEFLEKKTSEIGLIISTTQQEIELLKEYKTALISEVVTGKVDVRNEKLN